MDQYLEESPVYPCLDQDLYISPQKRWSYCFRQPIFFFQVGMPPLRTWLSIQLTLVRVA